MTAGAGVALRHIRARPPAQAWPIAAARHLTRLPPTRQHTAIVKFAARAGSLAGAFGSVVFFEKGARMEQRRDRFGVGYVAPADHPGGIVQFHPFDFDHLVMVEYAGRR